MEGVKKRVINVHLMNKVIENIKFCVYLLNSSRLLKGAFYTLHGDLKADDAKCYNFRMSYPS